MAWNEPGGNGKDKNPWGGGKQNPPDLDEILRNMSRKLSKAFGNNGGDGGDEGGSAPSGAAFGIGFLGIIIFVLWLLSGIFIVGPAEKSVILRFGKYVETVDPGPHWIPRFIESQYTVDVQKLYNFTYTALMLNKDENIVSVSVAVQYRIDNLNNFLFNVVSPISSLKQATASALRQVVGQTSLDEILTTGREKVSFEVNKQLRTILNIYNVGIEVNDVALQTAKAPEEVKAAFDDAIKAKEDEVRYSNQAQAYQRGVQPIADGKAKRILKEAQAYKEQVILQARGDVEKFLQLLPEYKLAPRVTRERMYLDTMEEVLNHVSKVVVDVKGGNNMFYLPLEKMMQQNGGGKTETANTEHQSISAELKEASVQPSALESNTTTAFGGKRYQGRQRHTGRGIFE